MGADVLTELKDIHLPEAVSWWPLALGWWLLAFLLVVIIALFVVYHRYKTRNAYRRQALLLLEQHRQQWQRDQQHQHTQHALLTLLKRVALTLYPTQQVAGLYGQAWVDFLNRQTKTAYFDSTLSHTLIQGRYKPDSSADIEHLYQACRLWIKHHARPKGVT